MTLARRTLLLLALAAGLGACGSDEEGDPIPQDVAEAIVTQLEAIGNRVEAEEVGACEDLEQNDDSGTFAEVERQLAALPNGVDADVEDALRQSVDRLRELVDEACASLEDTETETVPEDTETVEAPTITEEEAPPPETIPEETVPEETPPAARRRGPRAARGLGHAG